MGKVKQPLCSASEAVPQKVAVSASRNVSLAGRWTLFLKVHSVQCSALVGFSPTPPPSITFIFQTRPADCIFDKYLSSTVNAHRLKNDL